MSLASRVATSTLLPGDGVCDARFPLSACRVMAPGESCGTVSAEAAGGPERPRHETGVDRVEVGGRSLVTPAQSLPSEGDD